MDTESLKLAYSIQDSIIEKDKKIRLIKLNELLSRLNKRLIEIGESDLPMNISELLNFLKTTKMDKYINAEVANEVAIDEYLDFSEEFMEIVSEKNVEEAGQRLMYKLLKFIRDSDLDDKEELYVNIKKFISENYYISVRDFEIKVKRNFGRKVYKMIRDMYEYADDINGEYLLCPVCGKEINIQDSKNGICKKVCNFYIKKYDLQPKKAIFNNRILKLNDGVYIYNLMSSIGEFEIYRKCLERFKNQNVVLYPNVDEYDISIENLDRNILINLDVKDARTPNKLIKVLLENTNIKKLESKSNRTFTYIVIPEHREFIYNIDKAGKYTKELQKLIDNERLNITAISERKLYSEIERIFEEF